MMCKKTKKLYQRMQFGIKKKEDAINTLKEKRKNIEESSAAGNKKSQDKKKLKK